MQQPIRRVAAIHDLSGFGRASLCNIIPVLATMGAQVCPIPTAVLSTHSGGFAGYTFHDLTDSMSDYIAHWQELQLSFDCIYSGFLGSPRQVELVLEAIAAFRSPATTVVVDPVMGDGGTLYSSVEGGMVGEMRRLVAKADIIVPNQTEAALLLGEDPAAPLDSRVVLKKRLKALSGLGPSTVLITSAADQEEPGLVGVAAYEKTSNSFWRIATPKLPGSYPGTGDIFASVMIGGLLQGDSLPISIDRAVQFISQCIKASNSYDYPKRDGVLLERELPLLRSPLPIGGYDTF